MGADQQADPIIVALDQGYPDFDNFNLGEEKQIVTE